VLEERSRAQRICRNTIANQISTQTTPAALKFDAAPGVLPKHVLVNIMSEVAALMDAPWTQVPFENRVPESVRAYQIQRNRSGQWSKQISAWLANSDEHHRFSVKYMVPVLLLMMHVGA